MKFRMETLSLWPCSMRRLNGVAGASEPGVGAPVRERSALSVRAWCKMRHGSSGRAAGLCPAPCTASGELRTCTMNRPPTQLLRCTPSYLLGRPWWAAFCPRECRRLLASAGLSSHLSLRIWGPGQAGLAAPRFTGWNDVSSLVSARRQIIAKRTKFLPSSSWK